MNQEVNSSVPPQPSIKPAPSAFPGWMIGLMFLGVGLFGGLLIGKYVYTPKPIPQPIVSVSPTPTSDPTANWKTYTDMDYHFSFKYPPALWAEARRKGLVYLKTKEEYEVFSVSIFPKDKNIKAENFVKNYTTISNTGKDVKFIPYYSMVLMPQG